MRILLVGLGLVLFLVTVVTALTRVQPGERAVVRRFGRILPDQPGPGLHRGLPWGIDRVDRVPVDGVRRINVGFSGSDDEDASASPPGQMITGDHNLVNVQAELQYSVTEAEKFVLQADSVDALVARAAESVLAEWIASRGVDEVFRRGKVLLPDYLREQTQERLRPYDLGIAIGQASVVQLVPPKKVEAAFDELAQAQTDIGSKINLAQQQAESKRREAESESYRLRHAAQAYAQKQTIQARAEAESFQQRLDRYREISRDNPAYLNTLWQDEMTRLYAGMQKAGRIDVLDHYLAGEGLNITQFPLQPKKK